MATEETMERWDDEDEEDYNPPRLTIGKTEGESFIGLTIKLLIISILLIGCYQGYLYWEKRHQPTDNIVIREYRIAVSPDGKRLQLMTIYEDSNGYLKIDQEE